MSDESKLGITGIIASALVATSLIGWGVTSTVHGNAEHTERMEMCVAAGGDWDRVSEASTQYACTNVSNP